ncbi:MAG: hypothetical protein WA172_00740, partial [Terriglobales bacterium]
NYRGLLKEVGTKKLSLPNTDFDTGKDTEPGEYALGDKAYAYLLDRLANDKFANLTPALRENILSYYSNPAAPNTTQRDPAEWRKTQDELQRLKDFTPPPTPAAKVASAF